MFISMVKAMRNFLAYGMIVPRYQYNGRDIIPYNNMEYNIIITSEIESEYIELIYFIYVFLWLKRKRKRRN